MRTRIPLLLLSILLASARPAQAGAMVQQQQMKQRRAIQQKAIIQRAQQEKIKQAVVARQQQSTSEIDVNQLDKILKKDSSVWLQIIDWPVKELIVQDYIELYRAQGVIIRKSPQHYAKLIEAMSRDDTQFLRQPFDRVMMVVAVMEYDFDNGQDKDHMAHRILGDEGYRQNRQRLQAQ